MTVAKKASKSASIIDDEQQMVEKIAHDIHPSSSSLERQQVRARPASASERQNGEPSEGPNPDVGMTTVVDSVLQQEAEEDNQTVRMVDVAGNEIDVEGVANVRLHERSGWKRLKEEEA
jgi:hypothetical protein